VARSVIPFQRPGSSGRDFIEVGGPVDSFEVSVIFYSPELVPEELTALLGVQPTHAARKGSQRSPRQAPLRKGVWYISRAAASPIELEEVLSEMLDTLPSDPEVWKGLAARFEITISIALYLEAWSRGFELSLAATQRIAALGASIGVSVYGPDDA
jgi:hypothetical protein